MGSFRAWKEGRQTGEGERTESDARQLGCSITVLEIWCLQLYQALEKVQRGLAGRADAGHSLGASAAGVSHLPGGQERPQQQVCSAQG